MKILVTKKPGTYQGWVRSKSLADAENVVGTIDVLVYNSSDEESIECVKRISSIKSKNPGCLLVYLKNSRDCDNKIKVIVTGEKGKYVDDEFFLENVNELNGLIDRIDEVTAMSELGSVDVVKDFFQRYLKDGGSKCTPAYLSLVKKSVSSMVSSYNEKDLEMLRLSESATQLFKQAVDITSSIEKERTEMESALLELKELRESERFSSPSLSTPNVIFYPTVNYLRDKDIISIKEIGYCPFLMSFILGFRIYLDRVKNLRPKLIIIEPYGKNIEKKYDKVGNWVTSEKRNNIGCYGGPIVFVNCPFKEVIDKVLDDINFDTFIIVDRTQNSFKHIVNSKNKEVFYAVQGDRDIERNKLPREKCFSGCSKIQGGMFTVPVFSNFPGQSNLRENVYLMSCEKFYNMLYTIKRY